MCLSVHGDIVAVTQGSLVDIYNVSSKSHVVVRLPSSDKVPGPSVEGDNIIDVALSPDCTFLAVMTGFSKRLFIYDMGLLHTPKIFDLPRAASRARFTTDSSQVLVADKTGDALLYDLQDPANSGVKLFGHLSVLLDILMTEDNNYIITSDRDEKIRVSHYPNTYNIKAYCLGHKEFVKHIQLLPNDKRFLTSSSGDGSIKIWDYIDGRLCHTIETEEHIEDKQFLTSFVEVMDKDGVEVSALPIVHMSSTKIDTQSSLIAVVLHTYLKVLIFRITVKDQLFEHKLHCNLSLERFPSAIQFSNGNLFVCFEGDNCYVKVYQVSEFASILHTYKMFTGENMLKGSSKEADINLLYKRKFDNVQEYQERKRQRLEKHGES